MSTSLRVATSLAAVLMVTSCTSSAATHTSGAPSTRESPAKRSDPEKWTCQEGKFHWGKVAKRQVLAAVSDGQRFDVPAGKTVRARFEAIPIRSIRASISTSPGGKDLDPQAAVASLEEKTGLQLEKVGASFALSNEDKVLKTEFGKFSGVLVDVVGVDLVEASFVYGCGRSDGKPVRGTLNTWSPFTYSGLFKCGIDEELSQSEIEAENLMCGEAKEH
ncbi:hypothetical protein [Streptomyces sp. NPDC059743]|uniref:hypothetical protein n=1 Tax=Streptomyces sp. NPDC059743 TaxID=3346928 RepID=UPI00365A6C6D